MFLLLFIMFYINYFVYVYLSDCEASVCGKLVVSKVEESRATYLTI